MMEYQTKKFIYFRRISEVLKAYGHFCANIIGLVEKMSSGQISFLKNVLKFNSSAISDSNTTSVCSLQLTHTLKLRHFFKICTLTSTLSHSGGLVKLFENCLDTDFPMFLKVEVNVQI